MPLQVFGLGALDFDDLEDVGDELDEKLFGVNFLEKIKIHEGDVQKEYFNHLHKYH